MLTVVVTRVKPERSGDCSVSAALAKCGLDHGVYWHQDPGLCIKYSAGLGME